MTSSTCPVFYITMSSQKFFRAINKLFYFREAFKEVILKKLAIIDVATNTASEEEKQRLENLKKKYEEVI